MVLPAMRKSLQDSLFLALGLVLSSLGGTGDARAQIVDTLSGYSHSDPGWNGEVEATFSATGGNTEVVHTTAAVRLQYRVGAHLWRSMGGFQRATTEGIENVRSAFGHLRHNAYFTPAVASLAFVQVQENPFQRLRSRWLFGVGARFELVGQEDRAVAVGLAQMTEIERVEGRDGQDVDQRLSSFLSLNTQLREHLAFDLIVFAQPLWEDFSDLRATLDATLAVELDGPLQLTVGWVATHDSRPPENVEKTDWATKVGLRLEL